MFILSSMSSGKSYKNIKFLHEISSNSSNDLLGTNVYKTLEPR